MAAVVDDGCEGEPEAEAAAEGVEADGNGDTEEREDAADLHRRDEADGAADGGLAADGGPVAGGDPAAKSDPGADRLQHSKIRDFHQMAICANGSV